LFDGDDAEVDLLDRGIVAGIDGDDKRRNSDGTLLNQGAALEKKRSDEIEQVEHSDRK
jgi:hypothetical protein